MTFKNTFGNICKKWLKIDLNHFGINIYLWTELEGNPSDWVAFSISDSALFFSPFQVFSFLNFLDCITCTFCKTSYGRRLRGHFRDVKRKYKDASEKVFRHLKLTNHSRQDMAVCGLSLHLSISESHKTLEQKIIFQIGTLDTHGINERFSFNRLILVLMSPYSRQ